MSSIGADSRVTLYFSLSLENGDVVDSNFDKTPASFTIGDGSLLAGFEKCLLGLTVGAKQAFVIPPAYGFGALNPNNLQTFKRRDFADAVGLTEGLVVSFADAAGGELPGVVKSLQGEEVIVDFNHPLAGHTIIFKVEITDVQ